MLPDLAISPTHWRFGQRAGINLQYGLTNHRAEQGKTLEVNDPDDIWVARAGRLPDLSFRDFRRWIRLFRHGIQNIIESNDAWRWRDPHGVIAGPPWHHRTMCRGGGWNHNRLMRRGVVERFARFIVERRHWVLAAVAIATLVLGLQLRSLSVIVDADELLPRGHAFVQVTERVQALFGNRFSVLIGITPKQGSVWTPETLSKVKRLTDALAATPGIKIGNLQSLAARTAKDIRDAPDGLEVTPLLAAIPADTAAARLIAQRFANNPIYHNLFVSADERTAAVYVEFAKDPGGFSVITRKIDAAVAGIRDENTSVSIAGQPVFLAALERYSARMAWLLPIAVVVIGLIHFEAFRTVQGLVLPLATGALAVLWTLGLLTLSGGHLDPFNNVTPILILAVAAGHAVQVLKRYYEEFDNRIAAGAVDRRLASRDAVAASLVRVGPVMMAAGSIAALSFMSLSLFGIEAIRSFGLFAGIGIILTVLIELSFTPALRAVLPPPRHRDAEAERRGTAWDRLALAIGKEVAAPAGRRRIFVAWAVMALLLGGGASMVRIDNSLRNFFGAGTAERQADRTLNAALAGTNNFFVLVEGRHEDAIKDPAVLRAMEATQRFLAAQQDVGATVSIVDILKQINRGMNGGAADAYRLPSDRDLVSQYLLLYAMSGDPADFETLVDYPYQNAVIRAFVKTDSSALVEKLNERLKPVIAANFPSSVTVRLGGSVTEPAAMNEEVVRGKLVNIAQITIVVFCVSALLFRSPLLAALILVPLAATVLAVFGAMGWSGVPLQIATATISALAIGVGADYAIYLGWRLREELRKGTPERLAVLAAYGGAGKAILFVASAVAGGFAVLALSLDFKIHLWLGLLVALSMVVAALSSLTLFGALLLTIRPRVIFGERGGRSRPSIASVPAAICLLMCLGCVIAVPGSAVAETPDASALLAASTKATQFRRSAATGRFVLINRGGQQRIRDTVSLSELKPDGVSNKRLIRFNSPADVRGTSVLTIENRGTDDDIWIYLPALKKVRRLTATGRRESFAGTDFSYGDVIGHPIADWTHQLMRQEILGGAATQVIVSQPRTPAVAALSGYSRRITWLRVDDAVPLKVEYYDMAGALLKVYTADDIRLIDASPRRFQAMRQTMRNIQSGHMTVIEYQTFRTDVAPSADNFTPRNLDRPF